MSSWNVGGHYTRREVQEALGASTAVGGPWFTGYREWHGEFFVFCNVGVPGRTQHDYDNYWDGDLLVWEAKGPTTITNPMIERITGGAHAVHVFTREDDRDAFEYQGRARAIQVDDTTPVRVIWRFGLKRRVLLSRAAIAEALAFQGFTLDELKTKSQRAHRGPLTFYLKNENESRRGVLVANPKFAPMVSDLRALRGVVRNVPDDLFIHNSSFRQFPERLHTGKRPTRYGLDFDFESSDALQAFVASLSSQGTKGGSLGAADDDPATETEAMRAERIGQGKFRRDLMDRWGRTCALTGVALPDVLRASHIKPWRDSSPKERHSPENGLLLAVHVDALFDRGLITFDDDGSLIASPLLPNVVLDQLGIGSSAAIVGLSSETKVFLKIHRDSYFKAS